MDKFINKSLTNIVLTKIMLVILPFYLPGINDDKGNGKSET